MGTARALENVNLPWASPGCPLTPPSLAIQASVWACLVQHTWTGVSRPLRKALAHPSKQTEPLLLPESEGP